VRIFLDTNVLVSAFATRGLCSDILRVVLRDHELVTSELVLQELARALGNKIHLPLESVRDALAVFKKCEVVEGPSPGSSRLELDPDMTIVSTAVEANAEVFVSGDRRLLEAAGSRIQTLSPRVFWETYLTERHDTSYPIPTENDDTPHVSESTDESVREKAFAFALSIITLCRAMERDKEYVLSRQLMRAGTSIGANIEEASAAESRKDFLHKMTIASKEARESNYWLRLIRESNIFPHLDLDTHLDASLELIRLLTAIVKTTARTTR
jgi:putative PIN family toxin of toxin-antitoxin system